MLVAAAIVPTPPLLVPEIAGGSAERDAALRSACDQAVRVLQDCDRLVVLGPAPETRGYDGSWDWRGFGVASPPVPPARRLPLALAVGDWLLDRAGSDLPRTHLGVAGPVRPGVEGRTGLLVCGDGSARRDVKAPGHLDPRAEAFDTDCARALASGDPAEVLALDAGLGRELLASGVPAWHALARAAGGPRTAALSWTGAPYGVGYLVGTWT